MIKEITIMKSSCNSFYHHHIVLSDDDDMARQYKRIYAQGNALIRKFYMCTEDVKCTLFKS